MIFAIFKRQKKRKLKRFSCQTWRKTILAILSVEFLRWLCPQGHMREKTRADLKDSSCWTNLWIYIPHCLHAKKMHAPLAPIDTWAHKHMSVYCCQIRKSHFTFEFADLSDSVFYPHQPVHKHVTFIREHFIDVNRTSPRLLNYTFTCVKGANYWIKLAWQRDL